MRSSACACLIGGKNCISNTIFKFALFVYAVQYCHVVDLQSNYTMQDVNEINGVHYGAYTKGEGFFLQCE